MKIRLVIILLAALLLPMGTYAAFNSWFYAPHGLEELGKAQGFEAWQIAAKDFCASTNMTYQDVELYKFRAAQTGPDACIWGVARCTTPDGQTRKAWINLEWSTKREMWMRNNLTILADGDDEIFYSRTTPKQLERAATALRKIFLENSRRVREFKLTAVAR